MRMVERGAFFCSHYTLNDAKSVAGRIFKSEHLPTFTGITNQDKSHINRARFNLFALLIPVHDRKRALSEFVNVSREWNELTGFHEEVEDYEAFFSNYLKIKRRENYIREYTREIFLYHILNQALRRLNSPLDNFYIRLPFQDIFLAVLKLYHQQRDQGFRKDDFVCHRACILSEEEFESFSLNIEGYVQMEGFLSTSLEEEQVLINYKGYNKDTIIEIQVKANEFGGDLDYGFASIQHCSHIPKEKEVLFNPINIFKVHACFQNQVRKYKGEDFEVKRVVVLEFGGFEGLVKRVHAGEAVEEMERKTIVNCLHQEKRLSGGFASQGQAIYETGQYEQSYQWSQRGLQYFQQTED